MSQEHNIAVLRARSRSEELHRLNRLTGLQFESLPVSLLTQPVNTHEKEDWDAFAESLLSEALNLWNTPPQRQADGGK
ncbi:MAG: hypothetical protein IT470_03910 [Pseudomonadales bacterium]|nr:hypothetical protein [Pseudomonadales bacterium]